MTLPDELRVLNTLNDIKIRHNSVFIVEEKGAEELAGDGGEKASEDIELLDDSDNTRTVIANVSGYEEYQRYQFNLDWTLTELCDFLVVQFNLSG